MTDGDGSGRDPDAILERVRAQDDRASRGKLKIFVGFAPGVGKTYRMLQGAGALHALGVDVVVGVVETHGRAETGELLKGLAILPRRTLGHRGRTLEEFDLDAALARRPALLLVDELAHTNVPGSRHAKRWEDVLDLLDAGIDVHTTLNIQHVESLNDVIAQITHVTVRETVPDAVLDRADEIQLVDIAPEELLDRLREGKVYLPEQAARAAEHFFRRGNLLALRELALRRAAERVREDVEAHRLEIGARSTWRTAERLAVCVGPAPSSADIVRAARRTAAGLQAPWIALHVERTDAPPPGDADRERIESHLRLADSLGGEVVRLRATGVADAILDFCRKRNVTRVLVGKPTHPRLRDRIRGSLLDALVRGSGDIEVTAISGDRIDGAEARAAPQPPQPIPWEPYAKALGIVTLATGSALALRALFAAPDVEMLYLLAIMISGIVYGRGPSLVAAAAAVASYDFFFVPPALTFAVSDARYGLTFVMMFGVGWAMSELSSRLRRQEADSRFREARTRALFELTRDLASVLRPVEIAEVAVRHAAAAFETGAVLLLPSPEGTLEPAASAPEGTALGPTEMGVARWVLTHGRPGGRGTDTIPGASAIAVPIAGAGSSAGVLALVQQGAAPLDLERRGFLEAIARQAASALERERLAGAARDADRRAAAEELRSTLLSSVSHDLRTPLAAIVGAVTTVRDESALPEATRREMLDTIVEEAGRLERLVSDLLDMTRLEAGAVALRREWVPVEEVVGSALERLAPLGAGVDVGATVPPDLPLVPLDPVLAEQMLINLLENASRHAAAGGRIDLAVLREGESLVIDVADRGPGIAPGDEETIFERFQRGRGASDGGSGLGLPIARAIARAHGGNLVARPREGGGAIFRVTLPLAGAPPRASSGAESS